MDYSYIILLSRIQFAFTLAFHILFPTLTIGLAGFLVLWEYKWLTTRKIEYYFLCRFWAKIFALAFGMGVVSGIVLSYEFGTNFSHFSHKAGNILGPLMSYEVLTAFFLEAGFLGIMLFGWNRVSKSMHYISTILVAIGTVISAFWIIAANSWMQTPQGFRIVDGVFFPSDWLSIIFNPSFVYRFFHMVLASYLTTAFLIAGISAWYLLHEKYQSIAKISFSLALAIAVFIAPLQIIVGDLHGLNTFKHQPLKISALEGHWDTQRGAPFIIFALPDQKNEKNHFVVEIPKLGSLILTHELNGEIIGLKSVPVEDRPFVPIVFFSFRLMVAIGLWLLLLAVLGLYFRLKGRLFIVKTYHKCCLYSAPLGFVAVIAGWITTEVGRQPWVVYNLMRTSEGASIIPLNIVACTLFSFVCLYFLLLYAFLYYLFKMIHQGFDKISKEEPDKLTAWLENTDAS
jgi:cytochrome d ubiquinol oxidase subunit I